MDVNPDSPWNPRIPADITPVDFEKLVLDWLSRAAERQGQIITAEHQGVAYGEGGDYRIDVRVSFSFLGGSAFLVLVECKHQKRPIERKEVMVLESMLRDANAQKAMLFSTSGFQSGALDFAATKHIATVAVVDGEWLYQTRALGHAPPKPPTWTKSDSYAGILMTKSSSSILSHSVDMRRTDAIESWLTEGHV